MPCARKVDQLSSAGTAAMLAAFSERLPASLVAARIRMASGEDISTRTLSRAKAEWDAEQRRRKSAREQMQDLLDASKAGNATAADMVHALSIEALMRDPEGMLAVDPVSLQKTSIAAQKVQIQERTLSLKERLLRLDEEKFGMLKRREEKAVAIAKELVDNAGRGESITEDQARRLREVYGLNN